MYVWGLGDIGGHAAVRSRCSSEGGCDVPPDSTEPRRLRGAASGLSGSGGSHHPVVIGVPASSRLGSDLEGLGPGCLAIESPVVLSILTWILLGMILFLTCLLTMTPTDLGLTLKTLPVLPW